MGAGRPMNNALKADYMGIVVEFPNGVGHWGRLAFRGHLTLHLPRGASLDSVDYIGLHSSIRDRKIPPRQLGASLDNTALWCSFLMGNGRRVLFWKDRGCGDSLLCVLFPSLFALALFKDAWVEDVWNFSVERELESLFLYIF
ncbi:hypothetical protein CK203_039790 [Vitis vinifera]|uniref:Uncharacterized protein n=1 Tax=Vitis vinifera TaxID=29760 RepID=A0A438HQC6_VITVI|nr:hypothetical protein CK203_039790 [Vitis vinifera]